MHAARRLSTGRACAMLEAGLHEGAAPGRKPGGMNSKNWSGDKNGHVLAAQDRERCSWFAFGTVHASILVKECASCGRYACNGVLPDRFRCGGPGVRSPCIIRPSHCHGREA